MDCCSPFENYNLKTKTEKLEMTEINNLSLPIYICLAKDKNADVRFSLAANPNIPKFVLNRLLEDENVFVSHRAKLSLEKKEEEAKRELKWIAKTSPCVYKLGRS